MYALHRGGSQGFNVHTAAAKVVCATYRKATRNHTLISETLYFLLK